MYGFSNYIQNNVAVNLFIGYITYMLISGNQIKAARALAGIEQQELAQIAGVNVNTVRNMEKSADGIVKVRLDTLMKVAAALESAGVEFVSENGGGPGVRLRKPEH